MYIPSNMIMILLLYCNNLVFNIYYLVFTYIYDRHDDMDVTMIILIVTGDIIQSANLEKIAINYDINFL